MKTLQARGMPKSAQSGFTIIELIVVILLLGILTATALPRFLDVTDEAHAAVVDAVQGGLLTGGALFRAAWTASGESTTDDVEQFGDGTLRGNSDGYPVGTADNDLDDEDDCAAVYNKVLQSGAPSVFATAFNADAETAIEGGTGDAGYDDEDFVVYAGAAATPTTCVFAYVGQFQSGTSTNTNTVPTLTFDTTSGSVTASTVALDTD